MYTGCLHIASRIKQLLFMRNRFECILLLVLWPSLLVGQGECGTMMSRADKELALTLSREVDTYDMQETYSIRDFPVSVHMVRTDEGEGNLSEEELRGAFRQLNDVYIGANIRFVQYGEVHYTDDSRLFDFDARTERGKAFLENQLVPNTINLFIFNEVETPSGLVCGYAYLPSYERDWVVMDKDCMLTGTLEHEMGHYFGLFHTHGEGWYTAELPDASNCDIAGDLICDTPADPNLSEYDDFCTDACQLSEPILYKGRLYQPDPTNYMSYNPFRHCRSRFTEGQYQKMAHTAKHERSYLLRAEDEKPPTSSILSGSFSLTISGDELPVKRSCNLYKTVEYYYAPTHFRMGFKNHQPIYVYVLNFSPDKTCSLLYPRSDESAYVSETFIEQSLDVLFTLEDPPGKEYLCILYAEEVLAIEEIVAKIDKVKGNFVQRLYRVLGDKIVWEEDAFYWDHAIMFSAMGRGNSVMPLIVEIDHR